MMKERIEKAKIRCKRKTVYNFGSKENSEEQNEVLSKMGLGFQFTPKVFSIVELVQATELNYQQIERLNPEVIEERERAQKIRHVVMDHILEDHRKKIKSNVSKKEMKMLIELNKDEDRLITSADKGKAIAIEHQESCRAKNQQQLDEMDCVKVNKSGKTLLRELHRKLVSTLKSMGLSKKEIRKYTVTGPDLAKFNLLIKIHKPETVYERITEAFLESALVRPGYVCITTEDVAVV